MQKVDPLVHQQEFNEDLNFVEDAPQPALGYNDEVIQDHRQEAESPPAQRRQNGGR